MKKFIPLIIIASLWLTGAASGYFLKNNTDLIKNSPLASLAGLDSVSEPLPSFGGGDNEDNISSDSKYVLFSGFPASVTNKNMLIALYNTETDNINYFPYNYYTGMGEWKEILSFLSEEELITFFQDQGLDVADEWEYLDQEDVFQIYIDNFTEDSYITLVREGEEKEQRVGTKEDLYKLIRDYSSELITQEQILNTLLVDYIIPGDTDLSDFSPKGELYNNEFTLSLTEKPLVSETKGKGISVLEDPDFRYINSLVEGEPLIIEEPIEEEPKQGGSSILDRLKDKEPSESTEENKPLSIKERLLQQQGN